MIDPGYPPRRRDGAERVVVVGTTGAGKTTFARRLAARLGCPHLELDSLHWLSGWTPLAAPEFRRQAEVWTRRPRWVADGNYSKVQEVLWRRADTLVWLDYPFPLVFGRLFWRTCRRVWSAEELWHGNRERFAAQFCHPSSLFLWAVQTHWRRRRRYPSLLASPSYAHLRVVRLRTPAAAARWLATASSPVTPPASAATA